MTPYLGTVKPTDSDPSVAEYCIIDKDGANRCPLGGEGRVRNANHCNENHHADCQNSCGPHENTTSTKLLDSPNEWNRSERKGSIHYCSQELSHEGSQTDLSKDDCAVVNGKIDALV